MSKNRSLRRGQLVSVHGPGSIVDIGDESFVVCGIERWREDRFDPCNLPRLARRLGKNRLLQPNTREGFGQIPASVCLHRFPRWLFCQVCRRMMKWMPEDESNLGPGKVPGCQHGSCRGKLVPMRFVQICENGHLDDVDWLFVVHQGGQCQRGDRLLFRASESGGSGLASLSVSCDSCQSSQNLQSLMIPGALRGACRSDDQYRGGRQPWQRDSDGTSCGEQLRVVQRGDSNLHYARTISALDIPDPDADGDTQSREEILARYRDNDAIEMLRMFHGSGAPIEDQLNRFAEKQGLAVDVVEELVLGVKTKEDVSEPPAVDDDEQTLRREEYPLLVRPDEFAGRHFQGSRYEIDASDFGDALHRCLESISLLHRLREVRVFRGFHRVRPGASDRLVPASLDPGKDWLPACEVFGEGIFFHFRREALKEWISELPAGEKDRSRQLADRIDDQGIAFLPEPTPELFLLHGFAHILMRQLCFECGYASSSLRERLYLDGAEMSGVLIYTADGDSEGTLGGLVRQGERDRLPAIIRRALVQAHWCSGDPLCSESENQGLAGLNRAACHACLLVSETSCELANALLDRRFLVGEDQDGDQELSGFFSGVLTESGAR